MEVLIILVLAVSTAYVWGKIITLSKKESSSLPEKPAAKAIHHTIIPARRPTTLRAWGMYIRRELYDTQRKLEGWR